MSDDTYALVSFLTTLAALGALYFRIQSARSYRRLLKLLAERQAAPPAPPAPAEALARVADQLELAEKLLTEYGSIGLWVKSDDSSDNRRKRECLKEADWAVSDASRSLARFREESGVPPEAVASLEADLKSLIAHLEPLPEMVTDIMDTNPVLDGHVSAALERLSDLRGRVGGLKAGESAGTTSD